MNNGHHDTTEGQPRLAAFLEARGAGGAEHIFLAYLSALNRRGWDAHVIVGGSLEADLEAKWRQWGPDLEFHPIEWRSRNEYRFPVILPSLDRGKVKRLKEALDELQPALVLINQPGPDNAQGAVRAAAALRQKVPIACLIHQAPVGIIPMRLLFWKKVWARHIYRMVDRVIPVSHACAASMKEHFGVPEEKISVVWNGVRDVGYFRDEEAVRRARRSLAVCDEDVMVLWIGRLSYEKGVDVLLEALRKAGDCAPKIRTLLVGQGDARNDLEQEAAELIGNGVVRFLGWRDDVDTLLNACDIIAVPSRLEGFGLLIAEGMAASKPVVASKVYGTAEVLVDGETGIFVPVGDSKALASGLTRLAKDSVLRKRMGEAGRKRYEEHFTLEKAAERFEDVLAGRAG